MCPPLHLPSSTVAVFVDAAKRFDSPRTVDTRKSAAVSQELLEAEAPMLSKRLSCKWLRVAAMLITFLSGLLLPRDGAFAPRVKADSTPQSIPFSQDWSSTGQITADDNWAGVPGIVGFRGDDLTTSTATDPQTILADGSGTPVDVIANQVNPNTQATGGVAEFDGIANPVVGLQGSGTADAPHLVINVNTTGLSGVKIAYFLRDIDGSTDNSVQPVALQFRVGASGNYTNIPAGFVADASTGPSLATLVTLVSVTLPAATDNQPLVQLRIITTNAIGSDEWIGIDNINVGVPSVAELDSFTANRFAGGSVLVEWHTGLEVDNLGFNVYRETNGKRVRLTPQIIAGSALMAGERTNLKAGYSYTWPDDSPTSKDARYWLEAIDLNGESTLFGPVTTTQTPTRNGLPPNSGRAQLLNGVGRGNRPASFGAPISRFAGAQQTKADQFRLQSDVAGRQAIKISVNHEGWYRVTQPELVAAGLDQSVDPRMLQLFAGGREHHFIVTGEEDGRFDPSDYIEFYGLGLSSSETDTRVYWLAASAEPGRRVQSVKGKGARPAPASVTCTIERRDRTIYFAGLRNGSKENFFGAVIARDPVDHVINLEHLDRGATEEASIEIALQGVTTLAHRVKVEVNGVFAGELSFLGQSESVAALRVPHTVLNEGRNTVTLTPLEADSDVSLVSYIRISYSRALVADKNRIRLNLGNKRRATVSGFSSPSIRVWDVTEPDAVRQVTSLVQQQGEQYSVTVSSPKPGGRMLLALADDQTERVASITSNQTSNLRGVENAADFVIVAHRDFLESVKPLKALRESQGLKVAVVDVEDVYDEFSFGEKSAQSIKDFLTFARTTWRSGPRFALFVGDASLDPKNYMGRGDYDFVPTRFVDTLAMETASDEWLGDSDGDGLAELALGRLPVRTAAQASRIVDKIVSYDSSPMTRSILLVSDLNDGIDFQSEFSRVRPLVPEDVQMTHINRGELGTAAAKSQLIESLNRGLGILGYFGHGSIDQWRGDLLTSADAGALTNGEVRPLVFAITCLNGYFQDPALDSLAESLLHAERGGAVAVWASSGMCDSGPQAIMDQEMFRIIFAGRQNGEPLTLGEAAMKAKGYIGDADVRLTYILFGDPTSRIK
jgi:hypothetical protein